MEYHSTSRSTATHGRVATCYGQAGGAGREAGAAGRPFASSRSDFYIYGSAGGQATRLTSARSVEPSLTPDEKDKLFEAQMESHFNSSGKGAASGDKDDSDDGDQ